MSPADRPRGDESKHGDDEGVILRPEALVLPDEALVPTSNLIQPPPNRFTHELIADEPYQFDRLGHADEEPDGILRAGTPVVLLVDGDDRCRVVDARGMYVEIRRSSLRERRDHPPAP
jgi:hypothetical protein